MKKVLNMPYLGFGVGLRTEHYDDFLHGSPKVDWLEIISENFMLGAQRPQYYLDAFKERYPIIPHGVSLSIGSSDPLNWDYLHTLKKLVKSVKAPWFSDHLCWTGVHGHNLHNLMPLPYTAEVASFIAQKIRIVQDFMEIPFIFENVSSYVEFQQSELSEWQFISAILQEANCGLLLDINNVFVSGFNHHFDPQEYFKEIPLEHVVQCHIAGHTHKGDYILDTHDHDIIDDVWKLYEGLIPTLGDVSILLERDDDIPPINELEEELDKARNIYAKVKQHDTKAV